MKQRIIILQDNLIHEELSESGKLELSICLWNDGTEIPSDWHDKDADFMELKLDFSIKKIVDDFIEMHRIWDENDKIVFSDVSKELVEIYKKEFQEAIDRLNGITFMSGEEFDVKANEEVEFTIEVDDEADK